MRVPVLVMMSFGMFVAGCQAGDGPIDSFDLAAPNALGAVTIQLDRFEIKGDPVFELRGLDADGTEVALVRLRTGEIADLAETIGGTETFGSEMTFSAHGDERRLLTRQVGVYQLPPMPQRDLQELLDLPAVSAALEREASMFVARAQPATESAYQDGYMTFDCPASYMLTSPVAAQCCWQPSFQGTTHINPNNTTATRGKGPAPCTAQNGGSCSGASCFYGPYGFSRPSTWGNSGPVRVLTYYDYFLGTTMCTAFDWGTMTPVPAKEFPDVTGTQPTGAGCPGGLSGAGEWDY